MEGVVGFSLKEVLEKAWKEEFEKLKKNYFEEDFTNYSFLLEIGFPENVIKIQAGKIPADLVIMGTTGATGIREILGSTTSKVVDMVDCPVLAIPSSARFNGIKKMTIAYDEEKINDPDSYAMVLNLVRKFKSNLDIVNFNTTLKSGETENEGMLSLDPYLDGVKHKYHFKVANKIEKAITDFVEEEGTDILVMVAHDHGFIESLFHSSTTRKMVLHAKTPLLIIHE
jgi:nucleotide-binding universal stress UspA family protein